MKPASRNKEHLLVSNQKYTLGRSFSLRQPNTRFMNTRFVFGGVEKAGALFKFNEQFTNSVKILQQTTLLHTHLLPCTVEKRRKMLGKRYYVFQLFNTRISAILRIENKSTF